MIAFGESTEDRLKAMSALAPLEVRSGLRRRELSRDTTPENIASALELLEDESRRTPQVPLNSQVIQIASALVDRHPLRTLDALQLASAIVFRESLEQQNNLRFIASDHKLLQAAGQEDFELWNPATDT